MDNLVPEKIRNDADFAMTVVNEAENWEVRDQDDYNNAVELRREYKARLRVITVELEPAKVKTYAAYKDALDRFSKYTRPFVTADAMIKQKCEFWLNAENEKAKIKATAEAKLLLKAEKEKGTAKVDGVINLLRHGELPAIPTHTSGGGTKTKIQGATNPERWKACIMDYSVFLNHVAKGVNDSEKQKEMTDKAFLPWLQKHAEANQDAIPIPGVTFKKVIGMTVRA
jgi:hypothetical protein